MSHFGMSHYFQGSVAAPKKNINIAATLKAKIQAAAATARHNVTARATANKKTASQITWDDALIQYYGKQSTKGAFSYANTGGRGIGNQWHTDVEKAVAKGDITLLHRNVLNLADQVAYEDAFITPSVKQQKSGHNSHLCLAATQNEDAFLYLYGVAKYHLGTAPLVSADTRCSTKEQIDAFSNLQEKYKDTLAVMKVGLKLRGGARTRKSKNIFSSAKGWMKQMSRMFTKKTRKHRQ
jgi:hypothetical protein